MGYSILVLRMSVYYLTDENNRMDLLTIYSVKGEVVALLNLRNVLEALAYLEGCNGN